MLASQKKYYKPQIEIINYLPTMNYTKHVNDIYILSCEYIYIF